MDAADPGGVPCPGRGDRGRGGPSGGGLQALAAICAEILYRTAPPDPDDEKDKDLDRGCRSTPRSTGPGSCGVI